MPAPGEEPGVAAIAARAVAATLAWGLLHSLLASARAKQVAARVAGERDARAFYRVAYNAQAIVTFGALTVYLARHRGRTAYAVTGAAAVAMRVAQLGALALFAQAVREVGVGELSGFRHLGARLEGAVPPPMPVGQGPTVSGEAGVRTGGPFAWTRNPLNLLTVPILWLSPRASVARVAFNVAATVYVVAGSWHSERMQLAARPQAVGPYRASGVPFFLPRAPGG